MQSSSNNSEQNIPPQQEQVDGSFDQFLKNYFKNRIQEIIQDGFTKENCKRLFYANQNNDNIPSKPSLVSSAHGKLKKILTHQGGAGAPMYSLLDEMNRNCFNGCKILAVIDKNLRPSNNLNNVTFIDDKPQANRVNPWIQDLTITSCDTKTKKNYLIDIVRFENKKYDFNDFSKNLINDYPYFQKNYYTNGLPFKLTGGNILIGDHFFMISRSDFNFNCRAYQRHNDLQAAILKFGNNNLGFDDCFLNLMQSLLDANRKMIVVEELGLKVKDQKLRFSFIQPEFDPEDFQEHLDIFITLGGKYRKNSYLIFLAKPTKIGRGSNLMDDFFSDATVWWGYFKKYLESLDTGKRNRKFKVVQIELPCISKKTRVREEPMWVAYTYNNCIIEKAGGRKKAVMLPAYYEPNNENRILDKSDKKARRVFKKNGFKTANQINGLTDVLDDKLASLHCLTKDLIRK